MGGAAAGAATGAATWRVVVGAVDDSADAERGEAHDDASWAIGMECTEVAAVAAAIGLSDMLPRCTPWAAPSAHHSAPTAQDSALDRSTLTSIGASIYRYASTGSGGAHDGAHDSRRAQDGAPAYASAAPPLRSPGALTLTSPTGPEHVWRCKYGCGYESVRANAMGGHSRMCPRRAALVAACMSLAATDAAAAAAAAAPTAAATDGATDGAGDRATDGATFGAGACVGVLAAEGGTRRRDEHLHAEGPSTAAALVAGAFITAGASGATSGSGGGSGGGGGKAKGSSGRRVEPSRTSYRAPSAHPRSRKRPPRRPDPPSSVLPPTTAPISVLPPTTAPSSVLPPLHMQCGHAGEATSVASLVPSLMKRRRTEHMHVGGGAAPNSCSAPANAPANAPAATADCMQASKRPLPFDAGAIEKRRHEHPWGDEAQYGARELQGGAGAQYGAMGLVTTTTSLTAAWHAAAAGPGVRTGAVSSARKLVARSDLAAGSDLKRPPVSSARQLVARSDLAARSDLKRPPGRAPKGKRWDARAGWVKEEVEEEEVEEEEEDDDEEEEVEEDEANLASASGEAPEPSLVLAQSAADLWGSRGDLGEAHLGAPFCAVRLRLHSVAPNMAPPHVAPHAAPNMAPPSLDSESLGSPTLDSPTTRSLIEQWMDTVGLAGVNATD